MNTSDNQNINKKYTEFYTSRNPTKVYPTEFVVRIFLATYPHLSFTKKEGAKVLDLGFGDGRNTVFLCEQGYDVSGVEITPEIVSLTQKRLQNLNLNADLKVGRNSQIPFKDEAFDILLACHSSYYCDENETFADNQKEIARVLKTGGWFITSLPDINTYIFKDAERLENGHVRIKNDPYKNREDYKMIAFGNTDQIKDTLAPHFENFSFGKADNNYFGIDERVFWVVCQKT